MLVGFVGPFEIVRLVGLFEIVGLVGAVCGWLGIKKGGRGGLAGVHGKAG